MRTPIPSAGSVSTILSSTTIIPASIWRADHTATSSVQTSCKTVTIMACCWTAATPRTTPSRARNLQQRSGRHRRTEWRWLQRVDRSGHSRQRRPGHRQDASDDGQNIVNAPNLTFDSINKQTGVVHGHADPSILGTVKVELYRVVPDPSGYGEGGVFLGRTTTDASGNWTITDTSPLALRGCYAAFVTESQWSSRLVRRNSAPTLAACSCR